MKCPECQSVNPAGSQFCLNCGALLRPAGEVFASRTKTLQSPIKGFAEGSIFGGNYRVIKELGKGGMGIVYEAEQQNPKRPVALKIIRGGVFVDKVRVKMFQREAQTLARLKHPHIAGIYESGCTDDGMHFFAMELVRGKTLSEYLQNKEDGLLSQAEVKGRLRLFQKICDAVSYAHQRGVIHRDLKPSNILVPHARSLSESDFQTSPEIKILDFGLARITDADVAVGTLVSEAGQIYGTFPYMSPEQVRGNPDEIDLRTDVYSLGVILYEMLTGELPYEITQTSLHEISRIICEESPKPLAKSWIGAKKPDSDIQTIVSKALEKEPGQRYQSVSALSEDLVRYLHNQPILARPPSAVYQIRKMIARHKVGFSFAVALVVLIVGFAVTMAVLSARIAAERDRADEEAAKAQTINTFLLETLGSANPIEGSRRDVTVLEALKIATEKIDKAFSGQPEVEAEVRFTIGVTYLRLGHYEEAERLLTSALEIFKNIFSKDNPNLAPPLTSLGVLRHEQGAYEEAELLYREALRVQRKAYGNENEKVLSILNNLALVLQDKGDLEAAEPLFREILERDRKLLGREHLNVAVDLNNLGRLLQEKGDFDSCEPLLREAVSILRKKKHPWLSIGLSNLGELLNRKGDYESAEPVFAEALSIGLRDLGDRNQDVAKIRSRYGECLIKLKRFEEAEEQLLNSLPILQESLGKHNERTQKTARLLVELYEAWGRRKEAARYRSFLPSMNQQPSQIIQD